MNLLKRDFDVPATLIEKANAATKAIVNSLPLTSKCSSWAREDSLGGSSA